VSKGRGVNPRELGGIRCRGGAGRRSPPPPAPAPASAGLGVGLLNFTVTPVAVVSARISSSEAREQRQNAPLSRHTRVSASRARPRRARVGKTRGCIVLGSWNGKRLGERFLRLFEAFLTPPSLQSGCNTEARAGGFAPSYAVIIIIFILFYFILLFKRGHNLFLCT